MIDWTGERPTFRSDGSIAGYLDRHDISPWAVNVRKERATAGLGWVYLRPTGEAQRFDSGRDSAAFNEIVGLAEAAGLV